MSIDLVNHIPGINVSAPFTPGANTPAPWNVPHTGMVDGVSIGTSSRNQAEVYNRILMQIATAIEAAGLTIDNNNWAQLSAAIAGIAAQTASSENVIINGGMGIDQRNSGGLFDNEYRYVIDRWFATALGGAGTGTATVSRVTDAPPGLTHSLKFQTVNAKSPAASDSFYIFQRVEGHLCSDFAFGTASAKDAGLVFSIKSSIAGTFSGHLRGKNGVLNIPGNFRSYVFEFTVDQPNTWERKKIIIPGDVVGAINTDASIDGLSVLFDMGSGSDYETSVGSWVSGDYYRSTSSTKLITIAGASFQVSGVSLRPGGVVSEFRHRPNELALCQRYFEASQFNHLAYGAGSAGMSLPWRVQKQNIPIIVVPSPPFAVNANNFSFTGNPFSFIYTFDVITTGLYSASSSIYGDADFY